jgi:hypothetical protein
VRADKKGRKEDRMREESQEERRKKKEERRKGKGREGKGGSEWQKKTKTKKGKGLLQVWVGVCVRGYECGCGCGWTERYKQLHRAACEWQLKESSGEDKRGERNGKETIHTACLLFNTLTLSVYSILSHLSLFYFDYWLCRKK